MGTASKRYAAVLSLLGWFALAAQLYISIASKANPLPEILARYFTYFTILTNLLVAVCCTAMWLSPASRWGRFFAGASTRTALAVYILVVGLIYNVVLRFLWQPQGLQRVVDELLHSVIPVLFVLHWFLFVAGERLPLKSLWPWLIYPLVYIVVVLIRGAFSGFYPYPFIDVKQIGMQQALINAVGVAAIFILLSLLFIAISRYIHNKKG